MYLVSAYFDDKANSRIQQLINKIAQKTGNTFMTDHHVLPHLTISSVEVRNGEQIVSAVQGFQGKLGRGNIHFVSVGVLLPYVMYIAPVLNEYMQNLSSVIYDSIMESDDANVSRFYRPMQWLPHVTIGKKLSSEQMKKAFEIVQNGFIPFEGEIVSLGVARTNPREDILRFELN